MKQTSALVLGFNGNDPSQRLYLAESDSQLVRKALEKLGFWIPNEAVKTGQNATLAELKGAAKRVSEERPVGLLFFFAGHGTLIKGRNHIELADDIYSLEEVRNTIFEHLAGVRRLIMIVDACRLVLGSHSTGSGFSPEALMRSEGRQPELRSEPPISPGTPPETAYMFGCNWGKSSYEIRDAQRGIFTGALISEIERSVPSDPLLLRDLADRLIMDQEQQAAVIDGHRLGLRTLGELPATPRSTDVGGPVDYLACSGKKALCLTVSGRLEILNPGRDWMLVRGTHFRSAGLAGPLFFAHTEFLLEIHLNAGRRRTYVDSDLDRFVSSPGGRWLASIPMVKSDRKAAIYSSEDASEVADELPIKGVRQLEFLDEKDGIRLIMTDAAGKVIIYDRSDRSTSQLTGRSQAIHTARLASVPDGNWAVWCDWTGRIWIWGHTDDTVEEPPAFAAPVVALACSPNGLIAAGLANGTVMLRQAEDAFEPFQPLSAVSVQGFVTALAFGESDSFLMIGTSRGLVSPILLSADPPAREHR